MSSHPSTCMATEAGWLVVPCNPIMLSLSPDDDMVFWFYRYSGPLLSLQDYKQRNPVWANTIPDNIQVQPPTFGATTDTLYGVSMLLSNQPDRKPHLLVLVLITNSNSRFPTYYFDYNLNGDFTDDEPYRFYSTRRTTTIRLRSQEHHFSFQLINPYYQTEYLDNPELTNPVDTAIYSTPQLIIPDNEGISAPGSQKDWAQSHRRNGWLADFRLTNNLAWIRYEYDVIDEGASYDYRVRANAKGVGLALGYQWRGWRLMGVADYENYYYWSTVLTRSDDQLTTKEVNKDRLPKNQYSYGVECSRQLPLGNTFNLTPFLQYVWYHYSNDNQYLPNLFTPEVQYELANRQQLSVGMALSANLTAHSQIYFRMGFADLAFEPTGFFKANDGSNPSSRNQKQVIQIGWTWRP